MTKLRDPFPAEQIGLLPRAKYKKNDQKGECTGNANDRGDGRTCGKYHVLPAVHLDYVGHARITERLLDVDPGWDWEPLALDDSGLPLIDYDDRGEANLWIVLSVDGVARLGIGTMPADRMDLYKTLVSDAIRNAAMRFGVALELWMKDDQEQTDRDANGEAEVDWERTAKLAVYDLAGQDKEVAADLYAQARGGYPDTLDADSGAALLAEIEAIVGVPEIDST